MNWLEGLIAILGLAILLRLWHQAAEIRFEQQILREGITDCFDQVFKTLEKIEDQLPQAQRLREEMHREGYDLLMDTRYRNRATGGEP